MKYTYDDFSNDNLSNDLTGVIDYDFIIVCIGTDRSIGDSLAPLIGTLLKGMNFELPIYGTLDDPIHAINIENKLKYIKDNHKNSKILSIDASMGSSLNNIILQNKPIKPGAGVGKFLPKVGDYSIIGVVCKTFNSMHSIRLNQIYKMAEYISKNIYNSYKTINTLKAV